MGREVGLLVCRHFETSRAQAVPSPFGDFDEEVTFLVRARGRLQLVQRC